MNYIINFEEVTKWMLTCYPEEGVGIVTQANLFIGVPNIHEEKLDHFAIDPRVMEDYEVKAIIHSHTYDPNDEELIRKMDDPRIPSEADMRGQLQTQVEWGIVICEGQHVTEPVWFGDYTHRPPLMDREFIHSIQDCLEFMKDWQYKESGLKLPAHPRKFDWFETGDNHFEDQFEKWGFIDVSEEPQQCGDVTFYRIRANVVNHIGVIVEPNLVTHHLFGRFPVTEPYAVWSKYCTKRIRHTSKISK